MQNILEDLVFVVQMKILSFLGLMFREYQKVPHEDVGRNRGYLGGRLNFDMYPYKIQTVFKLRSIDIQRRLQYAQIIMNLEEVELNFQQHLIVSDEKSFAFLVMLPSRTIGFGNRKTLSYSR